MALNSTCNSELLAKRLLPPGSESPRTARSRHCANPALLSPIRHDLQFGRRAAEVAYWFAVAIGGHGDIVHFIAINASCIGMNHLEANLFTLDAWCHSRRRLRFIRCHWGCWVVGWVAFFVLRSSLLFSFELAFMLTFAC